MARWPQQRCREKEATTSQLSPLQDGDGTAFNVSPAADVGEEDAGAVDYLLHQADHCSGPDAGLQLDLIYTSSAVPASPPLCRLDISAPSLASPAVSRGQPALRTQSPSVTSTPSQPHTPSQPTLNPHLSSTYIPSQPHFNHR